MASRPRTPLLWVAGVRLALGAVAIPLAPALFRDHFAVLLLLRPTKEVLLAGGFLVRRHDLGVPLLVLASLPMLVGGVWLFFAIGRAYDLTGDDMPKLARRMLPRDKVQRMCDLLSRRGAPVVVLGRLAAFPSTVVAAAAGSSDMPARTFLLADGAGALLSIVEVAGAGYVLGEAYEKAGPWLTAVGVAVLVVLAVLVGRWLRRA